MSHGTGPGTSASSPLAQLLGESSAMVSLREQVDRLLQRQADRGRRRAPILILGETGTGKGLLAGILHRAGPRAAGPFVDVNCAAIPDNLLEAELFGFERGAFTDARHAKAGLLQTAHGGVLFLDEIGLLPEGLQAKLLKVLEERTVRRLGSTRSESVDVWIVTATSEDLLAATRTRRFREDLYHRLAVLTLRLPPLRERGDDIVRLAEHFLARDCEEYGVAPKRLDPDARSALLAYRWPGNVRELANAMERIVLLADGGTVTAAMLGLPGSPSPGASVTPAGLTGPSGAHERRAILETETEAERQRLLEALRATSWNISRAAARLGLPRNTLRYRMEKLGLGTRPLPPGLPAPAPGGAARPERSETATGPGRPASDEAEAAAASSRPAGGFRWERRWLTFLRARLMSPTEPVGATEAIRALAAILDKVQGFGGQADEMSPTGLIAAFGIEPVEAAPRHAASAALAIQKFITRARSDDPARPAVILTLHTAELPVGFHRGVATIDADARLPVVARLEALAEQAGPGSVMASAQTASFLTRRFELVPVGSGLAPLGPTYRLAGSRDPDRGSAGFVGRDAELRLLRDRLQMASVGHGQIVSVVGEPGIGKSRLLLELRRVAVGAAWLEGQAVSFGRTIPFHPLIDLLRRVLRIDEGDREAAIGDKIEAAVADLGEDLRPLLPFVRQLVAGDSGSPEIRQMDAKLRRAETFDAMRRLFARMATRGVLVVVWEDLHWADQATEEFVASLASSIAAQPILMVLAYRPGYSPSVGDRPFHTRLALTSLSTVDCLAMARSLLGVAELPEALKGLILRTAEGNPFFVEEMLRSFQETGTIRREHGRLLLAPTLGEIVVPETVQDVIRARIERLAEAPRQVLAWAAVIGRDFTRRLLDRLVGVAAAAEEALRELTSVELIHETSLFPDLAYTFRHGLIRDVAYHALPAERRRSLHGDVARAIEELTGDRLAEQYEVLAYHFVEAAEWTKALDYLCRAAKKATEAFAIREALALYDRGLAVAERLDPEATVTSRITIHHSESALYFLMSDFDRARAAAEQVVALARQLGDPDREARALAAIAWVSMWAGKLDGALESARQAVLVAEPHGATVPLARAHLTTGFVRAVTGGLGEARESIEKALVAGRSTPPQADLSLSLAVAGLLKGWEGDFAGASELQAEGLGMAREQNLLLPLLFGAFLYGMTLTGRGDYEAALSLYREGLTLAERVGDEVIHHRLLNCLGWLHAELGDLAGAIELNQRSCEVGRRRGDPGTFPNALVNLAENHLTRGDLDLAAELLEEAHGFYLAPDASPWMRWRYAMRLFDGLGTLWLARGDRDRAIGFANDCLELASRTRSRKNMVKGWRLRGEIELASRDLDAAEEAFRQALSIAQGVGNPVQLWKTHAALGRLQAARRRPDAAGEAYRAACAVLERVKGSVGDPALRTSLADAPDVRRLYEVMESTGAVRHAGTG
jgi:DNA-binding NtrC family response regulator/tetratricopeptide (TPR) repeat protein